MREKLGLTEKEKTVEDLPLDFDPFKDILKRDKRLVPKKPKSTAAMAPTKKKTTPKKTTPKNTTPKKTTPKTHMKEATNKKTERYEDIPDMSNLQLSNDNKHCASDDDDENFMDVPSTVTEEWLLESSGSYNHPFKAFVEKMTGVKYDGKKKDM